MGAWGTGFLDNDSASDFVDDVLYIGMHKAIHEAKWDGKWYNTEPVLAMVELYMNCNSVVPVVFAQEVIDIIKTEIENNEYYIVQSKEWHSNDEERLEKLNKALEHVEKWWEEEKDDYLKWLESR